MVPRLNINNMLLRRLAPSLKISFSTEAKFVCVSVDDKSGIATLSLQKPPVNSINLELAEELTKAIKTLEGNKSRGLVLTSTVSNIFSGGLDIMEMYKPDPERLKKFWSTLQDLWLTLYGAKLPTAAAINGHSPAGGCLLACSCEYRVMVNDESKNFTIGLNETQLGLVAPSWFIASYDNVLPRRIAESALLAGKLFPVKEALSVGLIDEIATDKDDAVCKATAWIGQFSKISPNARNLTKMLLRGDALQSLRQNRELDLNTFVGIAQSEKVQKGLELYMAALKKK